MEKSCANGNECTVEKRENRIYFKDNFMEIKQGDSMNGFPGVDMKWNREHETTESSPCVDKFVNALYDYMEMRSKNIK